MTRLEVHGTNTLCALSTVSELCCTESSVLQNFNALLSHWDWFSRVSVVPDSGYDNL